MTWLFVRTSPVGGDDHAGPLVLVAVRLDVDGNDGRDHLVDELRDGDVAAEDSRSGRRAALVDGDVGGVGVVVVVRQGSDAGPDGPADESGHERHREPGPHSAGRTPAMVAHRPGRWRPQAVGRRTGPPWACWARSRTGPAASRHRAVAGTATVRSAAVRARGRREARSVPLVVADGGCAARRLAGSRLRTSSGFGGQDGVCFGCAGSGLLPWLLGVLAHVDPPEGDKRRRYRSAVGVARPGISRSPADVRCPCYGMAIPGRHRAGGARRGSVSAACHAGSTSN